MNTNSTPEQQADIQERITKANATLQELQLSIEAVVIKVKIADKDNQGNPVNVFADQVVPVLSDTKFNQVEVAPTPEVIPSDNAEVLPDETAQAA